MHSGPREVVQGNSGENPGGWRRERRWPTSAVDVVHCVAEKMSEAPAASVPRSCYASLVRFEERSGLPGSCLTMVVKSAMVEAAASKETVDKAPQFPLGAVAALELMVSLPGTALPLKVAFARLVQIYEVLRMDDMQRIKLADVELVESGLIAKLRKDPSSFHPKRNVCGGPDMVAERL